MAVVTFAHLAPFAHNMQKTSLSNMNLLTYFPSVTSQSCDVITIRLPAYYFPIVPHSNHGSISSSSRATAILNFGPIFSTLHISAQGHPKVKVKVAFDFQGTTSQYLPIVTMGLSVTVWPQYTSVTDRHTDISTMARAPLYCKYSNGHQKPLD